MAERLFGGLVDWQPPDLSVKMAERGTRGRNYRIPVMQVGEALCTAEIPPLLGPPGLQTGCWRAAVSLFFPVDSLLRRAGMLPGGRSDILAGRGITGQDGGRGMAGRATIGHTNDDGCRSLRTLTLLRRVS